MRRGAMNMAPSQLGIFTRSSREAERADIAYVVVPYTRTNTASQVPDKAPGVTLSFYDCRPTSRGDVRLKSADPAGCSRDPSKLSSHGPRPDLRPQGHP